MIENEYTAPWIIIYAVHNLKFGAFGFDSF